MLVKLEHPLKQEQLKEVTEEGIVMFVKPEHHQKQPEPKEVSEEGSEMLFNLIQLPHLLLVDYQYYTL